MKGKLITVVMLGFSINAHAELAAASNWLISSVRNSAYSHYYVIKSPTSGTARSYAISARNDARKACTEAKASYAFSLTDGAYIAQSEACDASTYLGKEVTYWNINR